LVQHVNEQRVSVMLAIPRTGAFALGNAADEIVTLVQK
jgi:hypothetical protein